MSGKRSLLPREHGAYGQLAFPAASALLLGRPSLSSLLLVVSAVAAFLGHEPLVVLLGRRGPRARREDGARAARALALAAGTAIVSAAVALALASPEARLSIVPTAILGIVATGLVLTAHEKTLGGETLVASALSSLALPVAVMAGVSWRAAGTAAIAWVLSFSIATLGVREVLAQSRGQGNKLSTIALSLGALGLGLALAARGALPWQGPLAALPFLVLCVPLVLRAPHPRHLKRVGWGLMAASGVTLAILLASGVGSLPVGGGHVASLP